MLVGALVTIRQRLRVGLHLKQPPGDLTPLGVIQAWQLGQDFRFAYRPSLRPFNGHRKSRLKQWLSLRALAAGPA